MHGQTKFFDYLSKESLQRESVHGKTLRKITSDLKTLRKITLGDLPCASLGSRGCFIGAEPFSLNVCLSSPASVTSADSFRLGIHMRATPHAPYVELALPLEEQAPPHPEEPIQRELALDEPEPETALWKCLHEEPSLFQRTQMASVEVGEEHHAGEHGLPYPGAQGSHEERNCA
jgi:hypothetical protein